MRDLKQERVDAFARGLCYQCRKRPVKSDCRYCPACIDSAGARRDAARQIRSADPLLCTRCGRSLPSSTFRWCALCRRKNKGA